MDVKVYKKEEVLQPEGTEYVYVPDIIDLIPSVTEDEQIVSVEILDDDSEALLEQSCSLATIWQRGLDPLELDDGIQWSEAVLDEISVLQLIEQINNAVAKVSLSVYVEFNSVTLDNGQSVLTYKLKAVA